MTTKKELKIFIGDMKPSTKEHSDGCYEAGSYWYASAKADIPGYDFCREIVAPRTNKTFPDGALGVRVDDDFWSVAALPYRFAELSIKEIVETLWPEHLAEATFEPDSKHSTNNTAESDSADL